RTLVPAALERCEVWAVSPIPLADPAFEQEVRRIAATTGHALRIAPGALAAFDGIATAMAGGLERLDVFVDLGAGDAPERELLFEGTARAVGQRFSEGVNVAIAAALAGPGLDATQVRVTRPAKGTIGRTMGFTVRSRAGIFELISRPRAVPAEDIHTVSASLIAMLRREAVGSSWGDARGSSLDVAGAGRHNQRNHGRCNMARDGFLILDSDLHMMEPDDVWSRYLDG